MSRQRLVIIAILVSLCGVPLFILTVITLIPNVFVEGLLRQSVERGAGLTFSTKDFKKIFPPGFEAAGVTMSSVSSGRKVVYIDRLRARLDILSFLAGRPALNVDVHVGHGKLRSTVTSVKGALDFAVSIDGIEADAIPWLSAMELKGPVSVTGTARLVKDGRFACPNGAVDLKSAGVDIDQPYTAAIAPFFKTKVDVDLAMTIDAKDCRARINGLWLNSADTALKLRGDVIVSKEILKSGLDLIVDINLKKGGDDGTLLAYMSRYRRSSNFYSLRLKGTMENPLIEG